MQEGKGIYPSIKNLGIETPLWPSETFCANSEVSDWINLGFELSYILDEWQKLSREASPIIKKTIKLQFKRGINSDNIHPFEEILWITIEPHINKPHAANFQKSCNRKIKNLQLSHAQLLGIGINQAKNSHFESAKTAFEKLNKDNGIDEDLSQRLQSIVINASLKNTSQQPRQSESWEDKVRQFKSDLQNTRRANEKLDKKNKASTKNHWNNLKALLREKSNPVILVAGMRHSGSTALFNIIQLGLKYSHKKYTATYSEYIKPQSIKHEPCLANLIKIHDYRNDYFTRADIIITSRRDLRDTIASAKRRDFGMLKQLGGEVHYARFNRSLHESWHQKSDFEMSYDDLIENPISVIRKIYDAVGVDSEIAPFVSAELKVLPTNQYDKTLLSPTHITDPKRVHSYDDTLKPDVIRKINEENDDWLERFGYSVNLH